MTFTGFIVSHVDSAHRIFAFCAQLFPSLHLRRHAHNQPGQLIDTAVTHMLDQAIAIADAFAKLV